LFSGATRKHYIAAKGRKTAAHGASRGAKWENPSPEGAKETLSTMRQVLAIRDKTAGVPVST